MVVRFVGAVATPQRTRFTILKRLLPAAGGLMSYGAQHAIHCN
jgi:hypothetical protein